MGLRKIKISNELVDYNREISLLLEKDIYTINNNLETLYEVADGADVLHLQLENKIQDIEGIIHNSEHNSVNIDPIDVAVIQESLKHFYYIAGVDKISVSLSKEDILKDTLTSMKVNLEDARDLLLRTKDTIKSIWDAIKKFFTTLWQKIKSWLPNRAKSAINAAVTSKRKLRKLEQEPKVKYAINEVIRIRIDMPGVQNSLNNINGSIEEINASSKVQDEKLDNLIITVEDLQNDQKEITPETRSKYLIFANKVAYTSAVLMGSTNGNLDLLITALRNLSMFSLNILEFFASAKKEGVLSPFKVASSTIIPGNNLPEYKEWLSHVADKNNVSIEDIRPLVFLPYFNTNENTKDSIISYTTLYTVYRGQSGSDIIDNDHILDPVYEVYNSKNIKNLTEYANLDSYKKINDFILKEALNIDKYISKTFKSIEEGIKKIEQQPDNTKDPKINGNKDMVAGKLSRSLIDIANKMLSLYKSDEMLSEFNTLINDSNIK